MAITAPQLVVLRFPSFRPPCRRHRRHLLHTRWDSGERKRAPDTVSILAMKNATKKFQPLNTCDVGHTGHQTDLIHKTKNFRCISSEV